MPGDSDPLKYDAGEWHGVRTGESGMCPCNPGSIQEMKSTPPIQCCVWTWENNGKDGNDSDPQGSLLEHLP